MCPRIIYGKEIMTATIAEIPSNLVRSSYTEQRAVWRTVMSHARIGSFSARATG